MFIVILYVFRLTCKWENKHNYEKNVYDIIDDLSVDKDTTLCSLTPHIITTTTTTKSINYIDASKNFKNFKYDLTWKWKNNLDLDEADSSY